MSAGCERGQFTFYASFARAIRRIKRPAERAAIYDAIVDYALYGSEPDPERLSDTAAAVFDLVRPNLDASRKKAEAGRLGGRQGKAGGEQEEAAGKGKGEAEHKTEPEKKAEPERKREPESEFKRKEFLPPETAKGPPAAPGQRPASQEPQKPWTGSLRRYC